MPPAAIHHAMMATNGPVAIPKVRGSEKMPEPTMDPTTIAVSANSESFWVAGVALMWRPRTEGGMLAGQLVSSLHDAPCERLGVSGDYLVEGEDSPSRFCAYPSHGICGA